MAVESITKTLGSGSGIDLKALVTSLVEAQYAAKTKQITTKTETLTAQISGVAKLKGAITGFDSALKSLVKSGSLATQPTSSNAAVVGTSLIAGGTAPPGGTTLTVKRVAAAQTSVTEKIAAARTFPAGTLSIKEGDAAARQVAIKAGATLTDVAAAFRQAGLTATIVKDGDDQRLSIKGATGAAQAFSVAVVAGDPPAPVANAGAGDLATFATGANGGLVTRAEARDAEIVMDGVTYVRANNSVSDLVPGVKLDLVATSDTPVTIGATRPTAALSQAVSDVVATFNELQAVLKEATNSATGVLRSDSAASGIARALAALTTTKLATSLTGGPQTLADIGVATNRDGTVRVDSARLAKVLASDPAGVEALFADGAGASGGGLSAALSAVATRLTDKTVGLDAAATRYTKQQTDLAATKAKLADATTATTERMTRQFAGMDARVAAYKTTQTFLTNQIAAWNRSDS